MTAHTTAQQPPRLNLDEYQIEVVAWIVDHLPLSFAAIHCGPARVLLDWSIEDLSSASGVSPQAIQRLEEGGSVNSITMQAVAFAFETEGLVFFPGHPPLRGENCRGSTKNPRSRSDYHLLE
ncbi:helix-turn-helix transcriptional regulator [Pseudomonas inefficax]|nr:helix-turn-helix transcriptional regulator [Pseudomonas inefficax]MEE1907452.1 helix-turn-helix transcriptional regulator [Pseudomonas inefficax]MEE1984916.1 helix-turn-helix transcriptional regulator [Pseudomonas inefficax]